LGFGLISQVLGIVLIDLVLSGDNAVVIGMAARRLPSAQRRRAIIFGGGAAVVLRIVFTAIASKLLLVPLLQFVGGLLLVWIAFNLLRPETGEEHVREGRNMLDAIRVIVIADAVMSLDNMLAVGAAAHGSIELLLFGLILSIPLLLVGSSLVASLMNRFPWLLWIGAAVLAWTAGRMIAEDRRLHVLFEGLPRPELLVPAVVVVLVLGVSYARNRRHGAGGGDVAPTRLEEQGQPVEGTGAPR
jgi:YjbE family integral membrane protein